MVIAFFQYFLNKSNIFKCIFIFLFVWMEIFRVSVFIQQKRLSYNLRAAHFQQFCNGRLFTLVL